jgi:hypothetical protein
LCFLPVLFTLHQQNSQLSLTMANIKTLLDEIVMEVAHYLKPAVSMNRPLSLASLSRCSKRFNIFCRPLIYESVFLYMKTIRLLVRSIYERLELGLLIKYMNFAGNTYWGSDTSCDRIPVIPANSMTEDGSHSSEPQDLTWRLAPQGTTTSHSSTSSTLRDERVCWSHDPLGRRIEIGWR